MKITFPGKAERKAAPLDHSVLLAALAAQRANRDAVRAAQSAEHAPASEEPIAEIVLAGPEWERARASQQGCFNRAQAEGRP